jgi:alkylation response protein AidB-like acyl-CoA dehydrogenase
MDFHDTTDEAAFRGEVHDFIVATLPRGYGTPDFQTSEEQEKAFRADWIKALAARRWIAPHWPTEYEGAGLTTVEQFIFNEEMAQYRTPTGIGGSGLQMIGPTLILYGSDEQKQRFLPPIAKGEVYWCQGYTEPGSGSDLASLQTRAVRDGDEYVINGQKIFTSFAHYAEWMFMLARTDPEAPKHRGISMFLLDMKTPGITVSPLIDMSDDHYFNQVFFDNVRVPATQMVGEEHRGWYVGAALLDFERSNIRQSIELKHMVADISQFARENRGANQALFSALPAIRMELADRALEAEVARLLSYRVASMQKAGRVPNHESSMGKAWRTETQQRISRTGMKVIGLYGNLKPRSPWAPLNGKLVFYYLNSVNATIGAGTSEIQRNIIAQRGLGLPRD